MNQSVLVEGIAFEPTLGGARIQADICSPLSATCEMRGGGEGKW